MKRLLPLLFAAACCQAHAALDASACKPGPANLKPGAVQDASARLVAARSEPGERRFALADALADLALLVARQNGAPDIATDGMPSAAELLREALPIWQGAPRSAGAARVMQARGAEFFNNRQCKLARELLEMAQRTSTGAADATSVAIAQDLVRIGLAQGDTFLVRRHAAGVAAALDTRSQPLDAQEGETVLALLDFFYSQPDGGQDLQQAERLAQRGVALAAPGAALRRVFSYRLASIYYAQLRFAEGEALRKQLAKDRPEPGVIKYYFVHQREQLIALVRKGDLQAALGMARTMAEERQRASDTAVQALEKAEADVVKARAEAQKDPTAASPALSQALRSSALARSNRTQAVFWLARARSDLGEILHATGDLDGAARAYEAALARFREGPGGTWPDQIRTRSGLAIVYRLRGDIQRAQALQQEVLDALLPVLGEDHPDMKDARAELALLRKMQQG